MTTPAPDEPEPTTFAEWRAMQKRQDQRIELLLASQERTAEIAAENTAGIARIEATQERTAEIAAENTAGIARLQAAQERTAEIAAENTAGIARIEATQERTAEIAAENTAGIARLQASQERTAEIAAENTAGIARIEATQERTAEIAAENTAGIARLQAAQERTAEIAAENTAGIARLQAAQDRTTEIAAQNAREIGRVDAAHTRTAQDVATLKGWGLEFLCERRPEIFADAFNLRRIDLLPKTEVIRIAADAEDLGIITRQQRVVVAGADVYFYGLRRPDNDRVCLVTQVSFEVGVRDVERAVRQAGILNEIIRRMRPFPITGMALPVVAGTRQSEAAIAQSAAWGGVAFVPIYNGDSLMS